MKAAVRVSALLAVALVAAGCVGTSAFRGRRVPEWVLAPPSASDEAEFFVAAGSDSAGDLAAAEETAGYALLTRINQALGVDVTVLSTGEARSSLDSYEINLVQQVTQRGDGRIAGLRIADRHVLREGDRVTVYLLGEYERAAFDREATARRAFEQAREELLLDPERRADASRAAGDIGAAVEYYLQAAVAASRARDDGLRIAPAVLERALQRAVDLTRGLAMEAVSGPGATPAGSIPAAPVVFKLTVTDAGRVRPVAGAPVEVSYREARGSRVTVRTQVLASDADGLVRFAHPAVTMIGELTVTARLDLSRVGALLRELPLELRADREAVEAGFVNARAVHRFVGLSRAREIPTALLVVDTDALGSAMPASRAGDGMSQALTEAGFRLVPIDLDGRALLGKTTAEAILWLQRSAPAEVRRVIFGVTELAEFESRDGAMARVAGTVTVVDLSSSTILATVSGVKNARSTTAERALTTAFMQLGVDLGRALAVVLP